MASWTLLGQCARYEPAKLGKRPLTPRAVAKKASSGSHQKS